MDHFTAAGLNWPMVLYVLSGR